jgi:hypothetical protein
LDFEQYQKLKDVDRVLPDTVPGLVGNVQSVLVNSKDHSAFIQACEWLYIEAALTFLFIFIFFLPLNTRSRPQQDITMSADAPECRQCHVLQ